MFTVFASGFKTGLIKKCTLFQHDVNDYEKYQEISFVEKSRILDFPQMTTTTKSCPHIYPISFYLVQRILFHFVK